MIIPDGPPLALSLQESDYWKGADEYEDLLLKAVTSKRFRELLWEQGNANVDVPRYVEDNFEEELRAIDAKPSHKTQTLKQLCRRGVLEEHVHETGTPIFQYRVWTERQCDDAYRVRIHTEKLAIEYAWRLKHVDPSDATRNEHEMILAHLRKSLDAIAATHSHEELGFENGMKLIGQDEKFHRSWSGYNPPYTSVLQAGLAGHVQPTCRFLTIQRYEASKNGGRFAPSGQAGPTLQSVVERCHSELKKVYDMFVKTDSNIESLDSVYAAVEEHCQSGYECIQRAERLMDQN